MIFVCSRGRPECLARFFELSRPSLPGRVLVDEDDRSYDDFKLPPGWRYLMSPRAATVSKLNEAFGCYWHEPFYAVVCDDMVYRTPGWDATLAETCEADYLSWGDDGRWGPHLCTSFFLGGDLARKAGFLVHPGFGHLFADRAWWEIVTRTERARYCHNVHFDHHKAMDQTYFERRIAGDRERFDQFMKEDLDGLVSEIGLPQPRSPLPVVDSDVERGRNETAHGHHGDPPVEVSGATGGRQA